MANSKLIELLGSDAEALLSHECTTITKDMLHLPNPNHVDEVWASSNRNIPTLRSLQQILGAGRLAGTGYVSILPVDQGVEHSGGASFAPNPIYFDPENIVKLAIEGGCNAVASTYGVLGAVARKYAHKIPFIVKINHNEFLSYPDSYDQIMFGTIKNAWEMGAVAVGATIYFGKGDIAEYVDESGVIRILGRASVDILKSGGYKISALDIERVLLEHPAIAECAVVGLPDPAFGQTITAVVVLKPGEKELELGALKEWCQDKMSGYKVPRKLLALAQMPRNAMGKVNKKDLAKSITTTA